MSEKKQQLADGRICLHQDLGEIQNFSIDRFGDTVPSIFKTAAIFRQIASFIRYLSFGGIWTPGHGVIDDFKVFADEPTDDPRICVVWNPNTEKIQFSVIGMNLIQAEHSADIGATYMKALYINTQRIYDLENSEEERDGRGTNSS